MFLAKLIKFTVQNVFSQIFSLKMTKFLQEKKKLLNNLEFSRKNQQFYALLI